MDQKGAIYYKRKGSTPLVKFGLVRFNWGVDFKWFTEEAQEEESNSCNLNRYLFPVPIEGGGGSTGTDVSTREFIVMFQAKGKLKLIVGFLIKNQKEVQVDIYIFIYLKKKTFLQDPPTNGKKEIQRVTTLQYMTNPYNLKELKNEGDDVEAQRGTQNFSLFHRKSKSINLSSKKPSFPAIIPSADKNNLKRQKISPWYSKVGG